MNEKKAPAIRFQRFTDFWRHHNFGTISYRESTKQLSSEEYPCLEYEDVIPETGQLNKDIHEKKVQKTGIIFDNNKVLYGKLRPYLHNWIAPEFTGVATGDWWVLNPCGNNKDFLYALIQTKQFDTITNQSTGSKMPRADWKLVSSAEFYVPPIEEQREIGKCFHIIDNLISLHQRKLTKLQLLKKSMLTKMFPKDGARVPEIRFQGFHGDWKEQRLSKLAEVKDSARIPNSLWASEGVPYIRASDLTNDDLSGTLFLSSDTFSFYKNRTGAPEKGDVLFNGGGEIGKALLKPDDSDIYVQGGAVLYVKTSHAENLSGEYLTMYFQSPFAKDYINIAQAGGTMKHFTLQPAQDMPIVYPSDEEQHKIGVYFQHLDNLYAIHQRKLSKLQQIKQAMLSKLFV